MRLFPTIRSRPIRFMIGGLSVLVLAAIATLIVGIVLADPSVSCRRQGFSGSIAQQAYDSSDGTYFYASCQYRFLAEYWPDWTVREISPSNPVLSTVPFLADEQQQVVFGNSAGGMVARVFSNPSGRSLDDWQKYFLIQYPGSTSGGRLNYYGDTPSLQIKLHIGDRPEEMVLTTYRGNLLVFQSYGTANGNDWLGRTRTF